MLLEHTLILIKSFEWYVSRCCRYCTHVHSQENASDFYSSPFRFSWTKYGGFWFLLYLCIAHYTECIYFNCNTDEHWCCRFHWMSNSIRKKTTIARIAVNEFYEFLNAALWIRFAKSHSLWLRHQVVQWTLNIDSYWPSSHCIASSHSNPDFFHSTENSIDILWMVWSVK